MNTQKGTEFKVNGSSDMFSKIGDQPCSWSNAWCAVWNTAPEMRKNGNTGVTRKSPKNQSHS